MPMLFHLPLQTRAPLRCAVPLWCLCVFGAAPAAAVPLPDTYLGGADHGYGDVIGDPRLFDIHGAEIVREDGRLRVDIRTSFIGHVGVYASLTRNGKGIGYGDLLLGGAWTPFVKPGDSSAANTVGHLFDNAMNGTWWQYGLSLDDPWSKDASGSFSFYRLSGTNAENLVMTEELFKPGAIVRTGQAVHVDRAAPTVDLLGTGTWQVFDGPDARLSFDLDLSLDPTGRLEAWEYLSLHWGMTCNNDAIEGGVALPSVPEPGTLSLLGLGVAGGLAVRRRRRARH